MRPYLETSFPRPGINARRVMVPNYIPHYGTGSLNTTPSGYNNLVVDKFGANQQSLISAYCSGNFLASSAQYSSAIELMTGAIDVMAIQGLTAIASGINTYAFPYDVPPKKYCCLRLWGCATVTSMTISALKLVFADGAEKTLEEAVNEGRIQPMVLMASRVVNNTSYIFANPTAVYNGGSTGTKSYSNLFVGFVTIQAIKGYKVTSGSSITGSGQGATFSFCSENEGFKLIMT